MLYFSRQNRPTRGEPLARKRRRKRDHRRFHTHRCPVRKRPPQQRNKTQTNGLRQQRHRLKRLFGGRCMVCGYNKTFNALEFHHLDPASKEQSVSKAVQACGYDGAFEEALKCLLVCANCHREIENDITHVHPTIMQRQMDVVAINLVKEERQPPLDLS